MLLILKNNLNNPLHRNNMYYGGGTTLNIEKGYIKCYRYVYINHTQEMEYKIFRYT